MKSLAFYIEDIRRRFPYAYDSQNKPHFLQFQASPKNIVLQIFGIQLRCIYKQIYFITPRYLIWNQTHHWFIIQFDDFSLNLQIILLGIEISYILRILLDFDFCFRFTVLVIWNLIFWHRWYSLFILVYFVSCSFRQTMPDSKKISPPQNSLNYLIKSIEFSS